jgi:DNA-binding NarL/FixJ family response regulator
MSSFISLTSRQLEVAALIAEGRTNHDIAVRLMISERTVENHVARILAKLDLSSRTQVALWMVRNGPELESEET